MSVSEMCGGMPERSTAVGRNVLSRCPSKAFDGSGQGNLEVGQGECVLMASSIGLDGISWRNSVVKYCDVVRIAPRSRLACALHACM